MAISTTAGKNQMATAYGSLATHGAIYTSKPGAAAGTEPTGGTPAYARKPLTWGSPTNGTVTATAVFDVPAGANIQGVGVHTALTGGTYLDGGEVTAQLFATQGTLTVTFTYTQT